MNNTALAIIIMLISAAMYALSYVLQHKGTQESIGEGVENPGIGLLIRNRIWLLGLVLFGLSFIVHLAALAFGSVAIVQPLIVTELIFIPPFAALISHARISRRDWFAILTVSVGLAVFLIVAAPQEGSVEPSALDWTVTIAVFYAICGLLLLVGSRLPVNPRAAFFGVATGFINALLALVAKGMFSSSEGGSLLANPLTYVTIVVALTTVVLTAVAFRAGPITTSSPAMIATNPIVATIGAILIFGDTINTGLLAIVIIVACLGAIAWGIMALVNSEVVHSTLDD
jgi:drug/metabolite transporter (DMT)-like permease